VTESLSKSALAVILLVFILIYSCAKIGSPPGGPVDEQGPQILSTSPPSDSVNVARGNTISLTFDEKIDRKTIEGAIFISPRPEGEIEYKWKGETLNLVLPDSFKANTTYIVNLGTQIKDLHNNSLERSYSLAFSTGEKIADGKISGEIFNNNRTASGVSVGLYNIVDPIPPVVDSVYPPYLTQSGTNGEYVLKHIPDGHYFILAFIDKNKNQLFNYPKELFGIPDRIPAISANNKSTDIVFHLISEDTTSGFGILSVITTPDNLVKVRFSDKVSGELIDNNINKIVAVSTSNNGGQFHAESVKEADSPESSTYNFYFKNITEGNYIIELTDGFLSDGDSSEVVSQPFDFSYGEDKKPPLIEKMSHENRQVFPRDSVIQFLFSEPISRANAIKEGIRFGDTAGNSVEYIPEWKDYFRLELIAQGLEWGESYRIDLDERTFTDMTQNRLGDSVRTYEFSAYSLDSLGKISGTVTIDTSEIKFGVPYLEIVDLQGQTVVSRAVPSSQFEFSVAPGKYFLRGFLDRNDNGTYDFGQFNPFEFSESSASYPDTIRVRYRFETSGIELDFK